MTVETLPALYTHCAQVYDTMSKGAEKDGEGRTVWEGSGTKLLAALGLTNPYYSSVMKCLKAMDCIRQLKRGGGGQPSVWLLVQPPTAALWRSHAEPVLKDATTQKQSAEDQKMRDMNDRISALEGDMNMLKEAILRG